MRYSELLKLPQDYAPCMDLASIERQPDTWHNFYPHATFIDILGKLLESLDGNGRSIWIEGAYGVGKSHATLVLQKLFMDDETRVRNWLERHADLVDARIAKALWARRRENTLVVYDVNADGLNGNVQFLVRLQRSIGRTLRQLGLQAPLSGQMLERALERIRQEEAAFFAKRDELQSSLSSLNSSITDAEGLARTLERRLDRDDYALLTDIMTILEARNIYFAMDSRAFLDWVAEVLRINGFRRMVFIFDEFSGFVESNRADLTTFQQLAEGAQQGTFFIVPVTHQNLQSFTGAGVDTSRKISNRFKFMRLDMPTRVAMRLAGHVLQVRPGKREEWEAQRGELWQSVAGLVNNYMRAKDSDLNADDFRHMLPLHPMSATALKELAVFIGANQRSLLGFFNDQIFKDFMEVGGIDVANRQWLTIDQLWPYFTAQADPVTQQLVLPIRSEYARQEGRLEETEKRVFKAVLLYSLLESQYGSTASPLLNASVENIERSFEGDGALGPIVSDVLGQLAQKRCISIFNGHCHLFQQTVSNQDIEKIKKEWLDKFDRLALNPDKKVPIKDTQTFVRDSLRTNASSEAHYEIHVNSSKRYYNETERKRFGKDGTKILLQFLFARDEQERLALPQTARMLAEQFSDFRALFIVAPGASFCLADQKAWDKFVESWARYSMAGVAEKQVYASELVRANENWLNDLRGATLEIWQPNPGGPPFMRRASWNNLKTPVLYEYERQVFPYNPDYLSGGNLKALGAASALKTWAQAGLRLGDYRVPGAWQTVVKQWTDAGIRPAPDWFEKNPNHPLSRIREEFEKALKNNTAEHGVSLCWMYQKLQKAPYGLVTVPHTAMSLGFALRDWVTAGRGLQWSNGGSSGALDEAVLAEIIETALKSGGEKVKGEKLIFRLGPNEKAFIRAVEQIFGINLDDGAGVETALNALPEKLTSISHGVPLWILGYGLLDLPESERIMLTGLLEKLTEVLSISSRNDQKRKMDLVRELGSEFRSRKELAQIIKECMTPVNFAQAFENFLTQNQPQLMEQAARLGDASGMYRDAIIKRLRETGSWLAKRDDMERAVEQVALGLACCEALRDISGASYPTFEDASSHLRDAIYRDNHVPLNVWKNQFPALTRIFDIVLPQGILEDRLSELHALLVNNAEIIREVFYDPDHKMQIGWIAAKFPALWPTMLAESAAAYASLDADSAMMAETEFEQHVAESLEKRARIQHKRRLQEIWQRLTGFANPDEWSNRHHIPPQFALETEDTQLAENLLGALLEPDKAATSLLGEAAEFLEKPGSVRDPDLARTAFFEHIAYDRLKTAMLYASDQLTDWLAQKMPVPPRNWLTAPGFQNYLDEFMADYYKRSVMPSVLRQIASLPEDVAKSCLREIAEKIPDAGFYLINHQNEQR